MTTITSTVNPLATLTNSRQIGWIVVLAGPLLMCPLWLMVTTKFANPEGLFATWSGFIVVATALTAGYLDARWQLIPNWLTYSAAAWGVGLNAYAHAVPESAPILGSVGLGASLAGLILLFTLLLIIFSFTGGGAGDVKLAGAIGALLGFELGAEALLYAFVAAGIAIRIRAIGSVGPLKLVRLLARRFGGPFLPHWIDAPTEADRKLWLTSIPLGPYFAIGMLIVVTGFNHTIERWWFGG